MPIAQIGPWEFELPEGWNLTPNDSSGAYFEDSVASKGLYVKRIRPTEPRATATQLAEYIQQAHLRGFTDGAANDWDVVSQRISSEGELARSSLDLFDQSANYRVLSLVLASTDDAVQVSVHDYWCEDYAESQGAFASLEASMVKVASAG